ncbi:Bug family tripartite tricarboxylate transporter substrate binding protein [Ramlibacter alkalitolerans]|uniref:Tripartite tricarboxylate transporter substrate binding protein n=1 Tax=Ramlibacter alkalitolerans TaxID=2039631 RepID=A0ABS1JM21_9BURK|nr:tripartite tricarboxylate transporter substrate binding protein [Ramlibacter alkalitolerans]MBL0424936.1 tripartite tricarboxylate transporter substrate binding protein [Ramlibacter alkalitolerans]
MHPISRRAFAIYTGAATLGLAHAQTTFPSKPVILVVPYAPGGPTDAMARTLATALKPKLGDKEPVLVENKAGAGANIGAEYVARAEPDGHTIMFGTSAPLAINVSLYQKIGYDPVSSFTPIIYLGYLPNVLVVHPSLPVRNVQELIAYGKAHPRKLSFASSGSGASSHLAGVQFNQRAGTDFQHVPYKGTGPALNDLLGGQVSMAFTDVLTALPHIKAGKLRVLGVTTAARSRSLPDVPTVMEQGVPDYDVSVFFGIVGPAGMPRDVVQKLNTAFVGILQQPEVRQRLEAQGLAISNEQKPEQLGAFIQSEVKKWREVVRISGARAD